MGVFTAQQRPHSIDCASVDPNYESVFYTPNDILDTWQQSSDHCGDNQLAIVDSVSKQRQIKGILKPGLFWIGLSYESGVYKWASRNDHYHGWLSSKVSSEKDYQCAYVEVKEFSSLLNNMVVDLTWKWGDCGVKRGMICEIRHDLVDYSTVPCPDCFSQNQPYNGFIEQTVDGEQCSMWSSTNHDKSEDKVGNHHRRCKYDMGKMPYCKVTQHTTDGSVADEGSWMRSLTRNIIGRRLCNVPRCEAFVEKDLFSKTGAACQLNIVDSSFSTEVYKQHWNVCRKMGIGETREFS